MDYQTFLPQGDLNSLVKYYWTLEIPKEVSHEPQEILPDGCIEMAFILGDDIKRFQSDGSFILQPRAMVIVQSTKPFTIEPTGYVNTFAVKFYPYGFFNFVNVPLETLVDKETPIYELFGENHGRELESKIILAKNTKERIEIIENFLLEKLTEKSTVDQIVKSTIDILMATNGRASITEIIDEDLAKRRQLERKFLKHIGMSPKKLSKILRIQSALKILLNMDSKNLTEIAYESDYYDQAHFIKDFKEFTGASPKNFLINSKMTLSSLFYK